MFLFLHKVKCMKLENILTLFNDKIDNKSKVDIQKHISAYIVNTIRDMRKRGLRKC